MAGCHCRSLSIDSLGICWRKRPNRMILPFWVWSYGTEIEEVPHRFRDQVNHSCSRHFQIEPIPRKPPQTTGVGRVVALDQYRLPRQSEASFPLLLQPLELSVAKPRIGLIKVMDKKPGQLPTVERSAGESGERCGLR